MNKIYVIGGANVDIYAKSKKALVLRDSNPSKISFSFGGVGRNIACNLANYKNKVTFISAFGNDLFSKELQEQLTTANIDISSSFVSKSQGSSIYMAVLDQSDMFLGNVDMDVLDNIDPNYLSRFVSAIDEKDILIFDTNLKEETIEYIANNLKGYKVVDAISTSKVVKLKNILNKIDLLKVNLLEAETLAGNKLDSEQKIEIFIKEINKQVKEILVTDKEKLYIGKNNNIRKYQHHSYNQKPVNVTGAGDCLLASYIHGIVNNYDEDFKVYFAISASIMNVESKNAVADNSIEDVINRMKQIRIEKKWKL